MLKNGFDSKIVKDKVPNLPNTLIYVLRVYDFTEVLYNIFTEYRVKIISL
jgi:hypothetical protein